MPYKVVTPTCCTIFFYRMGSYNLLLLWQLILSSLVCSLLRSLATNYSILKETNLMGVDTQVLIHLHHISGMLA